MRCKSHPTYVTQRGQERQYRCARVAISVRNTSERGLIILALRDDTKEVLATSRSSAKFIYDVYVNVSRSTL